MNDFDLHAVKARAKAVIKDNRQDTPEERTGLVLAAQALEVIAEVHRLRDPYKITDDMIERAADAMSISERGYGTDSEVLPGSMSAGYRFQARVALEAALKEDQ
ncbi:hypothetical protein [Rothia koreensis]|uniref:hypothetical protein n=1 Tax=Rothia koreensis TaxID=592378 RepID=UPI003FCD159A